MRAFQFAVAGATSAVLVDCAIEPAARQASLDSWQVMPVEALLFSPPCHEGTHRFAWR